MDTAYDRRISRYDGHHLQDLIQLSSKSVAEWVQKFDYRLGEYSPNAPCPSGGSRAAAGLIDSAVKIFAKPERTTTVVR